MRSTMFALACLVPAMVMVTACSVPRGGNSPMSDVAGCAAVLPLARDTVHGKGSLVVVHSLGPKAADELYTELGAPPRPRPSGVPAPPPTPDQLPKTCIVVYEGDYPAGSVTGADAGATGKYALIVARVRHPVVYRVLLSPTLPAHLPGR
jgi:hypothetical protein